MREMRREKIDYWAQREASNGDKKKEKEKSFIIKSPGEKKQQ